MNPKQMLAEFSYYYNYYASYVSRVLVLHGLSHGVVRLLSKEHSKRPCLISTPPQWEGGGQEGTCKYTTLYCPQVGDILQNMKTPLQCFAIHLS